MMGVVVFVVVFVVIVAGFALARAAGRDFPPPPRPSTPTVHDADLDDPEGLAVLPDDTLRVIARDPSPRHATRASHARRELSRRARRRAARNDEGGR